VDEGVECWGNKILEKKSGKSLLKCRITMTLKDNKNE